MDTAELNEIKKKLEEIQSTQASLLNISKKHLELYAQQIGKSDELTNTFIELQKQSQQHQRLSIMLVLLALFAIAAYVLFASS